MQRLLADLQSGEPAWPPRYVFPLYVGASWGAVGTRVPEHWYEWYVEEQEDVDMPAGHLTGCYRLVFRTNPDDTTCWFCPGVGLARLRYRHHGSVHNEDWELLSYPGMASGEPAESESSVTLRLPGRDLGRLAYVQDGDLWVKGLPSGEPRRLFAWEEGEWAAVQGPWYKPGKPSVGERAP